MPRDRTSRPIGDQPRRVTKRAREARPPALILDWQRAVMEAVESDLGETRPDGRSVLSVALVRALYANPDGSSCYPSQGTIAGRAHVSRRMVINVDRWLTDAGLLEFVRHRARGVREHRLTIPRCAAIDTPAPHPAMSSSTQLDASAARQLRASCVDDDTQPHTSDVRRRDEVGAPPAADAPVDAPTERASAVARSIADRAKVHLEGTTVARAIDALLTTRQDWCDETITHLGAEIAAKATSNPTAYLTTGIERLAVGDQVLPMNLRLLNAWRTLDQLELELDRRDPSAATEFSQRQGLAMVCLEYLEPACGDGMAPLDPAELLDHLEPIDQQKVEGTLAAAINALELELTF